MPKISIIGAGNIGTQTLAAILKIFPQEPYEVILVNRNLNKAKGHLKDVVGWLDYIENPGAKVQHSSQIQDIENSDVIICTTGVSSSTINSSTREESLPFVWRMANELGDNIKKFAPKALVVTATNPVDIITQAIQSRTGFPPHMVIGSSTEIDARRFKRLLANKLKTLGITVEKIEATVIGGHSGQEMMMLENSIMVNGIKFGELENKYKIDKKLLEAAKQQANNEMKKEGFEIARLSGHGASFEPGLLLALMARAYIFKGFDVEMTAAYLVENIDKLRGYCLSLPVKIGKGSVKTVARDFASHLSDSELKELRSIAENHQQLFDQMEKVPSTLLHKIEKTQQLLESQTTKLVERIKLYTMTDDELESTTNKLLYQCKQEQGGRFLYISLKDHTIKTEQQQKLLDKIQSKFDKNDILFMKDEKVEKMVLRVEASINNKKTLENIGIIPDGQITANSQIISKL